MNRNKFILQLVCLIGIATILSLALIGLGVLIYPPKVCKHSELYGIKIYDTTLSANIIEIDSLRFIVLHKEKINNLK